MTCFPLARQGYPFTGPGESWPGMAKRDWSRHDPARRGEARRGPTRPGGARLPFASWLVRTWRGTTRLGWARRGLARLGGTVLHQAGLGLTGRVSARLPSRGSGLAGWGLVWLGSATARLGREGQDMTRRDGAEPGSTDLGCTGQDRARPGLAGHGTA